MASSSPRAKASAACTLWAYPALAASPLRAAAADTAATYRSASSQSPRAQQLVNSFLQLGQKLQHSQIPLTLADHESLAAAKVAGATLQVVPQAELDTAIVFDAPAPSQAAPNAMLLLVPEASRESWTESDVLAHVLEALALAKLRAVDPDLITRAGALLPALLLRDGDGTDSLADLWTTPVAP